MGKECFGPIPIAIPSLPNLPALTPYSISLSPTPDYMTRNTDLEPPKKRRKKERACDYCRHRKVKCDGPCMGNNVCSNCLNGRRICTYLESSRPRGPPKAYITTLEDRVERLEEAIKQLFPNTDFTPELGPSFIRGSWKNNESHTPRQPSGALVSEPSNAPAILLTRPQLSRHTHPSSRITPMNSRIPSSSNSRAFSQYTSYRSSSYLTSSDDSSSESEEESVETGLNGRQKLSLSALESSDSVQPDKIQFHGRSSTAALIETTRRFKQMCVRENRKQFDLDSESIRPDSGPRGISQNDRISLNKPDNETHRVLRRKQFWTQPQWERTWDNHGPESASLLASILEYFPGDEVVTRLFELYFIHTNAYLPLLHRPTFQLHWKQQLHHKNLWFSTVCLSMFAVASRWFDEDGFPPSDTNWKAIGWKWFLVVLDVYRVRKSSVCPATLFEVQTATLMSMFLRGTMHGPVVWFLASTGIRAVQDRGAHMKKTYKSGPNVDDELWKRAFWILLVFDHTIGPSLGRGSMIGEEDHDLDLPLEVDDEYWDTGDPKLDFKQPPAFIAKAVYPLNKNKVIFGLYNGNWTETVMTKLKAALEEWATGVPQHLRWPKSSSDPAFTDQSATIYSLYHIVQMSIWRQFCVSYPSAPKHHQYALSTCASSIRAVARILELQTQKGISNIPHMINVALVCAGTVSIVSSELTKKAVESELGDTSIQILTAEGIVCLQDLLDDLQVCVKMLRTLTQRWEWAEVVLDTLTEMNALPSNAKSSASMMAAGPTNGIPPAGLKLNAQDFRTFEGGTSSFQQCDIHLMDASPISMNGNLNPSYKTGVSKSEINGSTALEQCQGTPSSRTDSDREDQIAHLEEEFRLQLPTLPSAALPYQGRKHQSYFLAPGIPSQLPRSQDLSGTKVSTNAPSFHQLPSKGKQQSKLPGDAYSFERSTLTRDHTSPHQHRIRAMSMISDSGPEIQNISIPHINNTLRRVSYPNLHTAGGWSNDNAKNLESVVRNSGDLDCLRDSFNPIRQTDNIPSINQVWIREKVNLTPASDTSRQATSVKSKTMSKKPRTWGNDITYYIPEKNDRHNGKFLRSTEFRHWNQYPATPGTDSQVERSTSCEIPEHRYIQEMPFSR